MTSTVLIELFVEELPPKALKKLGEAFASAIGASLAAQELSTGASTVHAYASPRRLGARITAVRPEGNRKSVSQKLMPVSVGIDAQGRPTPALMKKLVALGLDDTAVPGLIRRLDGKAQALFFETERAGVTLARALQLALDDALRNLPIPKVMQYQLADGWSSVQFVRPAHALVALYGREIVPVTALGLVSGRITHGHRFEAATDPIELTDADGYESQLESQGAVLADFSSRRGEIVRQLEAAALVQGLKPVQDDALLDEVTALVERPNVLLCQFEPEYLEVPAECLILTMKANQKYFPLLDARGALTNRFLVVSNIRPADASRVVQGNERVVRPRLADAKFFFDQDRKRSLASRVAGLDKVGDHGKLGSQGQRARRVAALSAVIGQFLGGPALSVPAVIAARLAKADLLTDMVGEFPELQGVMGRYYARHDGHPEVVANAIEDHYKPRFAGDSLPRDEVGQVVALADKLETLVGMFSVGQRPTGDKDPYALRRHALGVVRILVERRLPIDVSWLLASAQQVFADPVLGPVPEFSVDEVSVAQQIADFLQDRLSNMLQEQGAMSADVDAVMALRPQRLCEIAARLDAVQQFRMQPEAASLAAANKRVGNILKKVDGHEVRSSTIDLTLLSEPAEFELVRALNEVAPFAHSAFLRGDYTESMRSLAALRDPVDAFFEAVMVNASDAAVRSNRLALLTRLHAAMNQVADLSKLAP